MGALLRCVHLLALGLWVGSVVFVSLVAAPALFGALTPDLAGRAVSVLFPRYYAFGAICGVLALVSGLLQAARPRERSSGLFAGLAATALMTGIVLYSGGVVLPRASEARLLLAEARGSAEEGPAQARFDALHRRSVLLNGTVLILGLAAFGVAAARRPPA